MVGRSKLTTGASAAGAARRVTEHALQSSGALPRRQAAPASCTRVLERTAEDQCGGTLTKAAAGPALPPNLSRLTRDAGRAAARPNAATDRRVNALMSKRTSAPPQALSLKDPVLGRCALTTSASAAGRGAHDTCGHHSTHSAGRRPLAAARQLHAHVRAHRRTDVRRHADECCFRTSPAAGLRGATLTMPLVPPPAPELRSTLARVPQPRGCQPAPPPLSKNPPWVGAR